MHRKDLLLVSILVATLALMVVPVSTTLIDVLLAVNISLSVTLLMVGIYLRRPSDFSTFPSVILVGTAFRLALSIATTRLILSEADAGSIVETFGDFVVAGSIGIGFVMFLIITTVQFLVVTKGSERVAEVSARFTLDAMPGRQMSIDAQAKAGDIEPEEAKELRAKLDRDNQFFGSMDGAMKFVKGDAIAGLVIICINLIGGIAIGTQVHLMPFSEAVSTFTLLTVGDGLVAQIPALLMAFSAGIIVTRVTDVESEDLGTDISKQLVNDLRVPVLGALIIFGIGIIPGFPFLIFAGISTLFLILARYLKPRDQGDGEASEEDAQKEFQPPVSESESEQKASTDGSQDQPKKLPYSKRFSLILDRSLSDSLDVALLESQILHRFWTLYSARAVRFPCPTVVVANSTQGQNWSIQIDEVPTYQGAIPLSHVLVQERAEELLMQFEGFENFTRFESKFISGIWVPVQYRDQLEEFGEEAISTEDLFALIIYRIYEENLGSLFGHTELSVVLDMLREVDAKAMEEIEEQLPQPSIFRLFKILIEDGVPLRPAELVVSSLYYWCHSLDEASPEALAEGLRGSMKRQLCHRLAGGVGALGLIVMDPDLEAEARSSVVELGSYQGTDINQTLPLEAEQIESIAKQFRQTLRTESPSGEAYNPIVVTSADLRYRMRRFLAGLGVHLPVLAPHELTTEIPTLPLATISLFPRGEEGYDLDYEEAEEGAEYTEEEPSDEFLEGDEDDFDDYSKLEGENFTFDKEDLTFQ